MKYFNKEAAFTYLTLTDICYDMYLISDNDYFERLHVLRQFCAPDDNNYISDIDIRISSFRKSHEDIHQNEFYYPENKKSTDWDEVWINRSLVNWYKDGQTIDKFLKKYEGHNEVKYRFWESSKKKMTYLSICFPMEYSKDVKIYLKDIITEQEGVKFSFILMRQIMDTQVEEIKYTE